MNRNWFDKIELINQSLNQKKIRKKERKENNNIKLDWFHMRNHEKMCIFYYSSISIAWVRNSFFP